MFKTRINSRRITLNIKTSNGTLACMLDTGANISCINLSTLQTLKPDTKIDKTSNTCTVYTASRQPISCVGLLLDIILCDKFGNDLKIPNVLFAVSLNDQFKDVVLGFDIFYGFQEITRVSNIITFFKFDNLERLQFLQTIAKQESTPYSNLISSLLSDKLTSTVSTARRLKVAEHYNPYTYKDSTDDIIYSNMESISELARQTPKSVARQLGMTSVVELAYLELCLQRKIQPLESDKQDLEI